MAFKLSLAMVAGVALSASWNYNQEGADWGNWYSLCDTGVQQSPIDLPSTESDILSTDQDLKIEGNNYSNYQQQQLLYNSHTVQLNTGTGNYLYTDQFDATWPFTFAQFHMHAPSEHTHEGKHYDLEMHFVHVIDQDRAKEMNYQGVADYAVIGVFFDREAGGNETNEFLNQLNIQSSASNSAVVNVNNVDVQDFLASQNYIEYYTYEGSFTTPPCTEGVKWVVLKNIQPISDAQLKQYTDRWAGNYNFAQGNGNNREVQPLNERKLYYSGASSLLMTSAAALVALMAW